MGIFDRFTKGFDVAYATNGVNINDLNVDSYCRHFPIFHNTNRKNYGEIFLYAITTKIFDGLRNVSWKCTDINNIKATNIISFIENNTSLLLFSYWQKGYAVVMVEKNGTLRLPYANELRKDKNGYIINNNAITIYSEPYQFDRSSHFEIVKPLLYNIDVNYNNSDFAAEQCGLYGVITGGSIPMSQAAKEDLEERLKKRYGFGQDKFNFLLSNNPIEYTPITMPIGELNFDEKIKRSISYICNFFKMNPMLIFGDSTFNNQEQALVDFYQNCIQPIAELLLLLARNIYIRVNETLRQPSTIITYTFENVPQFNKTLSSTCAEKTALLEYLLKLKDCGQDVDNEITKLAVEAKDLFNV